MREKRGGKVSSCNDCYFRQELLCALQCNQICPTFRPSVGRAARAPQQAQLIPVVDQFTMHAATVPVEPFPAVEYTAPPAVTSEADGVPFAANSPEATFTFSSLRAAAARRASGEQCVVSVAQFHADDSADGIECEPVPVVAGGVEQDQDEGSSMAPAGADTSVRDLVAVAQRVVDPGRVARVSRRVAQRYPNALQLC